MSNIDSKIQGEFGELNDSLEKYFQRENCESYRRIENKLYKLKKLLTDQIILIVMEKVNSSSRSTAALKNDLCVVNAIFEKHKKKRGIEKEDMIILNNIYRNNNIYKNE